MIVTTVSLVRTTAVTAMPERTASQPVPSDWAESMPSMMAWRMSSNTANVVSPTLAVALMFVAASSCA